MELIELISVGIGIVATMLGGVWFIVNKSFGVGRFAHRVEEVESRTAHAACTLHKNEIDQLKADMKSYRNDMAVVKSLLVLKHKDAASIFSMKNSPRQLNDTGRRLLADIKGMDFIRDHKDMLFSLIDANGPKTAYDVENAAHAACISCVNDDLFNGFKNFLYNSPSYIIKDADGKERNYDLTLPDVCFVLSLPLRDLYLEAHPQILRS